MIQLERKVFPCENCFCFITLRRATKRKLDILKVKGSRRCLPKGGPAIAFRERYAHLHCVTSLLAVSLYVLQSRCALHVVIPSLRVRFFFFFFFALSLLLPSSVTLPRPYPTLIPVSLAPLFVFLALLCTPAP